MGVAALAPPIVAQDTDPPMRWAAQEALDRHADSQNEGVAIVHWHDAAENEDRVFAAGRVTEMDGDDVVGTRWAVLK